MIICLWSGPRNVSTALMYSFAQRTDTAVIDEPLYAHYLRETGAQHPGREDVLAAMDANGQRVMASIVARHAPGRRAAGRHVFVKNMAHHLVGLDGSFLAEMRNVILTRDPRDMLPSLVVQIPDATLGDTGLAQQVALYDQLAARGEPPLVLDSRLLLLDPRGVLGSLCASLGIGFDDAMLRWPRGPRPEDGVWAPHWYHNVHRSTGFAPYRGKPAFPESLRPLLDQCRPYYDFLRQHAIDATQGDSPNAQHRPAQ
jgi:hypothetical protein